MTQTEPWTIGRLLTWTTDYLKQHGVEGARLDAEVLLAASRQCARIDLYAAYSEPASDEVRTAFRELVRRRAEGTPVAYLVGHREFFSLSFRVTPDVLIPRPETEMLVLTLLDRIKALRLDRPIRIADVGAGSGIIAIATAKQSPGVRVTAIDISPAALDIARANAAAHGVSDRVEFVEGDLLSQVPTTSAFDFIVSNPPYISTAEMEELARDVREHEPHLALHAGPRGTEVIERLLPQAAERLVPGGGLMIEISPMIKATVEALVANTPGLKAGPTVKDLAGLARVVQANRSSDS